MESRPARSLGQLAVQGNVPPRAALEILALLAETLADAGSSSDPDTVPGLGVGPTNIFVLPGGKLEWRGIDDRTSGSTRCHPVALQFDSAQATPPELLLSEPHPRSPVFSLGALWLWMVAGITIRRMRPEAARYAAWTEHLRRELLHTHPALTASAPVAFSMLAFDPDERPSPAVVAEQARAAAGSAAGDGFVRWSAQAIERV